MDKFEELHQLIEGIPRSSVATVDQFRGIRYGFSDDFRRIALLSKTLRPDNQALQRQADQFAAASRSLGEMRRQVNQPVEALRRITASHATALRQIRSFAHYRASIFPISDWQANLTAHMHATRRITALHATALRQIRSFAHHRASTSSILDWQANLTAHMHATRRITASHATALRQIRSFAHYRASIFPISDWQANLTAHMHATRRITALHATALRQTRSFAHYRVSTSSISDWQANLTAHMHAAVHFREVLKASWALPDRLDQSTIGFARLSRLSDAARTAKPYSTPVAELFTEELGSAAEFLPGQNANERDAAAIHAGLKPELIAFLPAVYSDVVLAAGFGFRITPMAVPQAVESGDPGATLDPMHWRVLTELEQRLRHVVEETLTKLDGSHWLKRRVPPSMRQRWEERQEGDRTAGRPVYAAIQYADFMDLADIVGRSDNWREAFQRIFRNKEDFITSLHRLHPVRKAIAHGRPLGRADVLTLVAEVTRIFGVLGIRVLN